MRSMYAFPAPNVGGNSRQCRAPHRGSLVGNLRHRLDQEETELFLQDTGNPAAANRG